MLRSVTIPEPNIQEEEGLGLYSCLLWDDRSALSSLQVCLYQGQFKGLNYNTAF